MRKIEMSKIEVLAPGMLTTVQDLGREGFGAIGVSASGAADAIALRIGNRLVGNAADAAGLEMTLLGGAFRVQERSIMSITGSDFGASLEGAALQPWRSFEVQAGQTLRFGPTQSGARCYLCVQGGIAVEPFLGSASTHLLSGLGGLEGRALRKGDVLHCGSAGSGFIPRSIAPAAWRRFQPRKALRVTRGPQWDWFSPEFREFFFGGGYVVAEESNRMGLRLQSPVEAVPQRGVAREVLSEGVALGAIQIPESGNPIVLWVEQQTTGGYPKIANVISADFHFVGQLRPRDEIRFECVDIETARALFMEQEELLASDALFAGAL